MSPKRVSSVAPYFPFKTFLTALDHLSLGTSDPIDRTALSSVSGTNVSPTLGALRFLGLIDDEGKRQPDLESLLNPDQRRDKLKELLETHYDLVVRDLRGMTSGRLIAVLGAYGVSGETAEKAKAFFLNAAKYAGLSLPAQLLEQKQSTRRTKQAISKPQLKAAAHQRSVEPDQVVEPNQTSKPDTRTVDLKSGHRISLTIVSWFDVAPEEREFVNNLVDAFSSPVVKPTVVKKEKTKGEVSAQIDFAEPDSGSWRDSGKTAAGPLPAPAQQAAPSPKVQLMTADSRSGGAPVETALPDCEADPPTPTKRPIQ